MEVWKPDLTEQKYIKLVMSMSVDCLMNKGTNTAKAYTQNLRTIADLIDEYNQPKE